MGYFELLLLACLTVIAGIAVLRMAWAQKKRSLGHNLGGWGLLVASLAAGGFAAGAWGVAFASLLAMIAALVLLAIAASGSQSRSAGKSSNRRVGMLPDAGEPLRLAGRFATFAIVIPGTFAASILFAIGLRGIALLLGAGEADGNAMALFAVPLVWGILAYVVLMRETRIAQLASLILCGAVGVVAFIPGA